MGPSEECHEQRAGASQHCYCHRETKAPAGSVPRRGIWTVKARKAHPPQTLQQSAAGTHTAGGATPAAEGLAMLPRRTVPGPAEQ